MEKQSPDRTVFRTHENKQKTTFSIISKIWKLVKVDKIRCVILVSEMCTYSRTSEAKDRPWPTVNFFDLLAKDQII